MAIKILGGEARGLALPSPSPKTRPTLVQLKRRLFDFQQDWHDEIFVDLCSGTGSMGIEAWSRGAKSVLLVERDKALQQKISALIREIQIKYSHLGALKTLPLSVERWVMQMPEWYKQLDQQDQTHTTIYLDPPYETHEIYLNFLSSFIQFMPQFRGRLMIESDQQKGMSTKKLEEALGPSHKLFTQGASFLAIWDFRAIS